MSPPQPPQRAHALPSKAGQCSLVAFVAAAIAVTVGAPARAHPTLVASETEDGATVTEPLEVIRLQFDETVEPDRVTVTAAEGNDVRTGAANVADSSVEQPLAGLPDTGTYDVTYQVLAADGHTVDGEITFTYLGSTTDDAPATQGDDEAAGLLRRWPVAALAAAAVALSAAGVWTWRRLG